MGSMVLLCEGSPMRTWLCQDSHDGQDDIPGTISPVRGYFSSNIPGTGLLFKQLSAADFRYIR
jgi:hypothetical protein